MLFESLYKCWLPYLGCCILLASAEVRSEEHLPTSMAQLKAKFDKTQKLVRIQNKATGKFLTYSPALQRATLKKSEFVDVKLEDADTFKESNQVWVLRETLGFPYTKNESFTRLYSVRPTHVTSAPGVQKNNREFSKSLWKFDTIGADSGEPFYRLKNTFSQECLTAVTSNIVNRPLENAEVHVHSKPCPEEGSHQGTEDNTLFYLKF